MLGDHIEIKNGQLSKGTNSRSEQSPLMAGDDEVIPSQERTESAGDESDTRAVRCMHPARVISFG